MTSEDYDKLTDEEKRIKVAELCGFTHIFHDQLTTALCGYVAEHEGVPHHIPNYLSDLNACHEFEKLLYPEVQTTTYPLENGYRYYIGVVCEADGRMFQMNMIRATAEQRCKAFVLTMERE